MKVTVVSGACGWDFQSIQRGEGEEVWLVIHNVKILLWLKRLQYCLDPVNVFLRAPG